MSNLTARQKQSLGNKLTRYAKSNCTNYFEGGECPLYGMCIVQIYSGSNTDFRCDYFEKAVLPANPTLESEYNRRYNLHSELNYRTCKQCEERYEPTGNAQKYCFKCADGRRRSRNRILMKERRLEKAIAQSNG